MAPENPNPIPTWQAESFEHLDLVERALALALSISRSPIDKPFALEDFPADAETARRTREEAQVALGLPFERLLALLSLNRRTLMELAGPDEIGATGGHGSRFLFSIERWGGSVSHRDLRMKLIAHLTELREQTIERLRVLSEDPRSRPIAALPTGDDALREEDRAPVWSQLIDTQQEIVRALSVKRLTRHELAERVFKSESMVQKALSDLMSFGFVAHIAGGGYVVQTPPIGAPSDVQTTP